MTFSKTDFLILEMMRQLKNQTLKESKSEKLRENIEEQYFREKAEKNSPEIDLTPDGERKCAKRLVKLKMLKTKRC